MKILFIGGSFNAERGGIERYNLTLFSHLKTLKHNVKAFSVNDSSVNGIKGFDRNFFRLLLNLIPASFSSEIILLGHRNFLPLIFLPGFWMKPKIMIAHGIEVWGFQPTSYRFFSRFLYSVWPVSTFTGHKVDKAFGHKFKQSLISNTLPDQFLKLPEAEILNKQKSKSQIRFLSVSRVAKAENYKNIDLCIQAIFSWSDTASVDWRYDIVIHGDDVIRHKELAFENENFVFHDHLPDKELRLLYLEATHFLLPSTGEGFGIVYLEAMANGCVCIGADTGGITDIINHGENGFLCSLPVNKANLVELITSSLSAENRFYLALNGWKSVNRFSFEAVNKKIEEALKEVMGN